MNSPSVTVRIPASTSNLGSGFDTLGLALKLYHRIRVTRLPGQGVEIVSPVPQTDRPDAEAMIHEAAALFFRRTRTAPFRIAVAATGEVPVARGLGYSAILRLGIVAALNELLAAGRNRRQLFEWVAQLEGHPDNAAPAVFGGFTAAGFANDRVPCLRFPVSPTVKFITLIPRARISTKLARTLLPTTYTRSDAAHALNRAALIAAAFAQRNYPSLRGLFDDRLHQPYRARLIPQLRRVIRAGERAGALGGFLSGSGSAIICVSLGRSQAIARAMRRCLPDAAVQILGADNRGFSLVLR